MNADGRKPGEPIGSQPRWKILYDGLNNLRDTQLLSYTDMGDLLGLDPEKANDRSAIYQALRKAIEELRRQTRKVVRIERGHGCRLATAEQVLVVARRHQGRAAREVAVAHDKVSAIDTSGLDSTTARLVEATRIGFARQSEMIRQLDVRQDRLDAALEALGVHQQKIDERVDGTQAELRQLKEQIARIEAATQDQQQGFPPKPVFKAGQ